LTHPPFSARHEIHEVTIFRVNLIQQNVFNQPTLGGSHLQELTVLQHLLEAILAQGGRTPDDVGCDVSPMGPNDLFLPIGKKGKNETVDLKNTNPEACI